MARAAIERRLRWLSQARPKQLAPSPDLRWRQWLLLAGRGFGKTRVGAEDTWWFAFRNPGARIGIVAPTFADGRDICIEGVSGIEACAPPEFIKTWNRSLGELTFANGSEVKLFTSEKPKGLRGPNHHRVWCEELGAWEYPDETWNMMRLGLRLPLLDGGRPRAVITTTPKPLPLLFRLVKNERTLITAGSTHENRANLAEDFLDEILAYDGTEIGRQEIYAELLDLSQLAILKRPWWKVWSRLDAPECEQVILSFDTAYKAEDDNSPSAMTAWGLFRREERWNAYDAILLDGWKDWLEYPDLRERAQSEVEKWGADFDVTCLIEDKGSGQSLIQELHKAGVQVHPHNPGRDSKIMRAHLTADVLKSGRIWVPGRRMEDRRDPVELAPYGEMVVSACEAFRGEKVEKDAQREDKVADVVDTCTQAWSYIRDLGGFRLDGDPEEAWKPKRKSGRAKFYGMWGAR